MIKEILKSIIKNFQTFLVIWAVVIIVNQLFIFGACFAPYCLIAALPHTSIIAALITYFSNESNNTEEVKGDSDQFQISPNDNSNTYIQPKEPLELDDFEDTIEPFCPKCGSKMKLRTAKKGKYTGQKFWGCSKFPNCNGILNI